MVPARFGMAASASLRRVHSLFRPDAADHRIAAWNTCGAVVRVGGGRGAGSGRAAGKAVVRSRSRDIAAARACGSGMACIDAAQLTNLIAYAAAPGVALQNEQRTAAAMADC